MPVYLRSPLSQISVVIGAGRAGGGDRGPPDPLLLTPAAAADLSVRALSCQETVSHTAIGGGQWEFPMMSSPQAGGGGVSSRPGEPGAGAGHRAAAAGGRGGHRDLQGSAAGSDRGTAEGGRVSQQRTGDGKELAGQTTAGECETTAAITVLKNQL